MVVKNFSPYRAIKEAVEDLKPNEKKVVLGRFGIDAEHQTLSSIGKDLHLSRERIRQIEREALKKVARKIIHEENPYISQIIETMEGNGGITNHEKIAEKFLDQVYAKNKNEFNSLHLIFVLMPDLLRIEKTKELEASWMLASLSKEDAIKIINDWVNHLKKTKKPASLEVLIEANPDHQKHKIAFLSELPLISKKLVKTESGEIGLATWPEVNPRNVRDKIYYVLKKNNKPMHFDDIAKAIGAQNFDKKKIVKATVHNELIADERFVLVGRGIYALAEWGFQEGTVADIIMEILTSEPKGLPVEEIVTRVMKQRVVKKNTVLINLQTKPLFKKISANIYGLK
ncbi:MAG: HTH domain-containing protein [Patescibacteria group bacterium]